VNVHHCIQSNKSYVLKIQLILFELPVLSMVTDMTKILRPICIPPES
jgi:hypothetical protein